MIRHVKTCTKCHESKPLDQFYKGKGRCKTCYSAAQRNRWAARTPEDRAVHVRRMVAWQRTDVGRANSRRARLKHRYGVTEAEYDHMLTEQGGHCALCPAKVSPRGRRLSVDHDHATGKVRGILCLRCNNQISLVDRVGVPALLEYLARGERDSRDR